MQACMLPSALVELLADEYLISHRSQAGSQNLSEEDPWIFPVADVMVVVHACEA